MRLIIDGFGQGLVDEEVITRMGLVKYQSGPGQNDITIVDCPASDIENFDFYTKHALVKMPGREQINSSPWQNSAIIRSYQWTDKFAGEHSLVFSCASGDTLAAIAELQVMNGVTVFNDISVSGTEWAPSINDAIDIVAFAGSAVMTYGGNIPLVVYTGGPSITPLLGTGVPSGAKVVASWGSYLFAANIIENGVRQRSRIVWSDPLNVNNWPASQYMDLDTEDGDPITAMWLFKDSLVVFKISKTYIIKYVGGVLIFDWERISNSIGCLGPNAIVEADGLLYFIGQDGFYVYDGQRPPQLISTNISRSVGRMNLDKSYTTEVDHYSDRNQLFFSVAEGSSEYKNKIYIYDTDTGSWTRTSKTVASLGNLLYGAHKLYIDYGNSYESYSQKIGDAAGAADAFLAMGSYDGILYRFGEIENDAGNPVHAYWVSPWIDFGYPDRNKRILRASIFLDSTHTSDYTLTFTVYSDWDDTTPKVIKTVSSAGAYKDITEKRIDFTLPVRSFKFKLEVNQLNATMVIHKVIFEFLIKGRTLVS